MSLSSSQNSFSRLTLVLRPPTTTERFLTTKCTGVIRTRDDSYLTYMLHCSIDVNQLDRKVGHSQFQTTPLRVETGQHPVAIENPARAGNLSGAAGAFSWSVIPREAEKAGVVIRYPMPTNSQSTQVEKGPLPNSKGTTRGQKGPVPTRE